MSTMRKIPVIILTKLMLGLPAGQVDEVQSMVGAFSICMEPDKRTCMNVIAGRRQNADGGFSLDKFALYYSPPNHTKAHPTKHTKHVTPKPKHQTSNRDAGWGGRRAAPGSVPEGTRTEKGLKGRAT